MKVRDRSDVSNVDLGGLSGAQGNAPAAGTPGNEPSGDSVLVSDIARALARLVDHGGELAAGLERIRSAKVEPLRAAIAGGTYVVDAEATARKFLEGVLGTRRG